MKRFSLGLGLVDPKLYQGPNRLAVLWAMLCRYLLKAAVMSYWFLSSVFRWRCLVHLEP
jgi:hypothetical protein